MKHEAEFVDKIVKYLQKYFTIEREVWSKCKTSRIDLVLKYSEGVYFGVECKQHSKKTGEEIGEHIKQSIRYSHLEFQVERGIFKKVPILIAPPISYEYFILNEERMIYKGSVWHKDRHTEFFEHHTGNGFIGAFGIGELRKGNNHLFISFSNKIIWSNEIKNTYENSLFTGKKVFGLHPKNYELLKKKLCLQ